jgi:hypothetical protein
MVDGEGSDSCPVSYSQHDICQETPDRVMTQGGYYLRIHIQLEARGTGRRSNFVSYIRRLCGC